MQNLRNLYPSLEDFILEFSPDAQALMARYERHAIMADYSTLETLNYDFGTNTASSWQGVNEKTAEKQK